MATVPPFSRVTIPPRPPGRTVVVEAQVVPLARGERLSLDELVELARRERALLRAELRRQLALTRIDAPSDAPATHWYARPWARIAAATMLGYALGRSKALRVLASLTFGATLALAVDRALTHAEPASARW